VKEAHSAKEIDGWKTKEAIVDKKNTKLHEEFAVLHTPDNGDA
jgi:hypothetical protein